MHDFHKREILKFTEYLRQQERSEATIKKYNHTLETFYCWLPEKKLVDKALAMQYKEELCKTHAPAGVNTILAALNGFFRFMGWHDCTVKALRIQRRIFSAPDEELSREEYLRLVDAAEQKRDRQLSLLLQLMASTGIRVSEIRYVTVEALGHNQVQIRLKGKIRTILLPGKLCHKLRKYQRQQKITSGPLFLSRSGNPLDRRSIWSRMKRICSAAKVKREKVYPHNLRHLFARAFYHVQKDIAKLADVLGHSSIETTRIYLLSSGQEHKKILDRLNLLC